MKVSVDQDLCIGAGNCVLTAPAVFDQDQDQAVVVLLDETPPASELPAIREAVGRCPSAVIRLET
jgi:ferredoxin